MSSFTSRAGAVALRLGLVASAVVAIVALTVATQRIAAARAAQPEAVSVPLLTAPVDPIAAEARVFLTGPGDLAVEPAFATRRSAHPRTLVTYDNLREYAGAPPRIPHGLTPDEFQHGGCNTCHERGGYSLRFGAYVPVTPHPEMGACLQCHVGDAKLMAIPLPSSDPNDRCRQCHESGGARWNESFPGWRGLVRPAVSRTTRGQSPPPIPHDLHLRGNCLSCHSSPGGVAGLRTAHPERADCRQCHVEGSAPATSYVRPAPLERDSTGSPR